MEFHDWRNILEYVRWTPSPHNTQHWRFRLDDPRHAVLYYDPARLLPVEDRGGRFMECGLGILLEMLSIAAASSDLDLKFTLLGVPLDASLCEPTPFANLELVRRENPEPLSRELILQRRTSRLPYDERPIGPDALEELSQVAESFGHQLGYSCDAAEIRWVISLNADTMFKDLGDIATRREIDSWIRYSTADAETRRDGLSATAMCFSNWMMRLFFRRNWLFTLPGLYWLSKWHYCHSMRGTQAIAWIRGKFSDQVSCITAGRMLARLWLTMTKHQIYLHPFGSVITNLESHQALEDYLDDDSRQAPIWLLTRLGHSREPPRSLRLALDDLIITSG